MKSLFDYEVLVNEVFYKCQHILKYIENNPTMSDLDKEAIKNTIMDALVTKGQIDKDTESLDFDNLCIVNNLNYHKYDECPNISGIPLWMKEEFRKKSLVITGGIPISIFLSNPPSKIARYCVYDPNTAVSSIFQDATFYNTIYDSPTRNIRLEESRPFVEVDINNEKYLVDTLTKRILKSSWFKDKYNLEILSSMSISTMDKEQLQYYKSHIKEDINLAVVLPFMLPLLQYNISAYDERKYEVEQSKRYFPSEWIRYKEIEQEMQNFKIDGFIYQKKK